MHRVSCNCTIECNCSVEPLLILVKPPQVISLDLQKYDGVILFVVLVVSDVDAPFFLWETPHTHPQPLLQSLFCHCSCWVYGCQVCCCHFHPNWKHLKKIGSQSANLLLSQNNATLVTVIGGWHREATTSNVSLLLVVFVFHSLSSSSSVAVLVDFINNREPDATVWPCTGILALLYDCD